MKITLSKEKLLLQEWDNFIINNNEGSHLLLSNWLQSFKSYGFDYEIAVVKENDKIIGGYGAVIAKILFLKFYIIPFGPLVLNNNLQVLEALINIIPQRAKIFKCCYCQINYPYSNNLSYNSHYQTSLNSTLFSNFKNGNLFNYVYSSNGLNWLDLTAVKSADELLLNLKSSVRRDIRSAERKNQEIRYLISEEDVKLGYDLCLQNAKIANYSIRDWSCFKPTLLLLIKQGNAKFIASFKDSEIKGAIFIVKAGNYYTYILGGTKKEKPDLLTGHLLQWEAIKLSIIEKCDGYNISLGGSAGVKEFKSNFNTTAIHFSDTKYHIVIKPLLFNFFLFFEKSVKPQKKLISKILSILKK